MRRGAPSGEPLVFVNRYAAPPVPGHGRRAVWEGDVDVSTPPLPGAGSVVVGRGRGVSCWPLARWVSPWLICGYLTVTGGLLAPGHPRRFQGRPGTPHHTTAQPLDPHGPGGCVVRVYGVRGVYDIT
jgi:hypothetical protein